MGYSSGILLDRITVLNRVGSSIDEYGAREGEFEESATIWASVQWAKGMKAMREGALDAYDTVMIRCRYTDKLTRSSRILHEGNTYVILSFHADKRGNTIQLTAQELSG